MAERMVTVPASLIEGAGAYIARALAEGAYVGTAGSNVVAQRLLDRLAASVHGPTPHAAILAAGDDPK